LAAFSDASKRARSNENSTEGLPGSTERKLHANEIIDWSSADSICNYTESESEDEEEVSKDLVTLKPEFYG
jgi:hypothetical protein